MSARKSPLERGFARLWRRPWFRRAFYNGIALGFGRNRKWRMMNCGWTPPDGAARAPDGADEALGRQLYLRVVDDVPLTDRRVVEIGSGRGGGCILLHETLHPARMVGLDYAGASVRWCRRHFSRPGLEFAAGSAMHTPFGDGSFDVAVCVELTHCLPDKVGFLGEMARIIAPGGTLLIADFFYRRPDASHALEKFQAAIRSSPFRVVAEEDLTAGVLAAMRADAGRRDTMIRESVPHLFRGLANYFGGSVDSPTYRSLDDGRSVYLRYRLLK